MASKLKWRKHKNGDETAGPFRIATNTGTARLYMLNDFMYGFEEASEAAVSAFKVQALRIARACAKALKEKP